VRFLLDNDVDHAVASLLRRVGHDVAAACEVGLGGAVPPADDEVTVCAIDRGMVVVTHDREFTARRKRHTIGLHVRLRCAQPDAVDVLRERYDELLDAHGGVRRYGVELLGQRVAPVCARLRPRACRDRRPPRRRRTSSVRHRLRRTLCGARPYPRNPGSTCRTAAAFVRRFIHGGGTTQPDSAAYVIAYAHVST
jgi:predicted nuclease of predicted toxin-antitoxin system